MCKSSEFNLSYDSLTSFEAGQTLRDLPVSDPEFYAERSRRPAPTLSAEEAKLEDVEENNLNIFGDDSEVPLAH